MVWQPGENFVGSYEIMQGHKDDADALKTLKKVASMVTPIMRKRNWHVGCLAEFIPEDTRLQGLNVNRGEKIYLRLRYTESKNFLPWEMIIDTCLHELVHIVQGPHDATFQRLWNELRDEYQTLRIKGFTGDNFIGRGKTLGGRRIPTREIQRQARAAAEKRRAQEARRQASDGHRLGGSARPRGGPGMRAVIAAAAEKRNQATVGCASGSRDVERKAEEQSRRAGLRTTAEEDELNERAIAQALMELMAEDEAKKIDDDEAHRLSEVIDLTDSPPKPSQFFDLTNSSPEPEASKSQKSKSPERTKVPDTWECDICTLINPIGNISCDACGIERPESVTNTLDRHKQEQAQEQAQAKQKEKSLGWVCERCGTFMEHQWWTCSRCSAMKPES
jgi:DNA-dependent metalloprotease WSS1